MKSIKSEIGDFTGEYHKGSFNCSHNELTSLEGSPESVGGYFDCHTNKLTSLAESPKSVGFGFICFGNELTSLEGAPRLVGSDFSCVGNTKLTSLEGAPESIGGAFYCDENIQYGENLYIIANALINGRKYHKNKNVFKSRVIIEVLLKYFTR